MNRKKFIELYCEDKGISKEEFDSKFVALPCTCKEDCCSGWGAIRRADPDSVYHQAMFCTPNHLVKIGRVCIYF